MIKSAARVRHRERVPKSRLRPDVDNKFRRNVLVTLLAWGAEDIRTHAHTHFLLLDTIAYRFFFFVACPKTYRLIGDNSRAYPYGALLRPFLGRN